MTLERLNAEVSHDEECGEWHKVRQKSLNAACLKNGFAHLTSPSGAQYG